jgi:hypothetical protein
VNDVEMERATRRGEEAARLLADTSLLSIAFEESRTALMRTWAALDTVENEKAKDLHRMLKCLDIVERVLRKHIETGQLAQHEIQGREKRLFSLSGVKNALGRS